MRSVNLEERNFAAIKKYLSLVIVLLLLSGLGCSRTYKPAELKGYYKPLVQEQFTLNEEDKKNKEQYVKAIAEGKKPSLKYYFELNGQSYYILNDAVYLHNGSKLTDLQPNSEGYFVYGDKLYYVYGKEKEKIKNTPGGPVAYILKDYQYRELSVSLIEDRPIKKEEYEKLYFELNRAGFEPAGESD